MIAARISISFLIFLAPLVALGTWKIRQTRAVMKQAERETRPFTAPHPTPVPAFLLRFQPEERGYLIQSLKISGYLFLLLAWTYAFIISLSITHIASNAHLWTNQSAMQWLLFLRSLSGTLQTMATMPFLSAFFVVGMLRFGNDARFYRTRPLRLNFLFWSRFLPVTLALFAGIATGCALGMAILYAAKGPIWHNLPPVIPRVLGPDDADLVEDYAALLATSAPRMFLSLLTTTAMLYSLAAAALSMPFRRLRPGNLSPIAIPILLLLLVPISMIVTSFIGGGSYLQKLFIYNSLGPPPPYSHALIPIALTLALLALARHFVRQFEL
jgi:hypothetical protein